MRLTRRISELEQTFYKLRFEHYGAHWQEFYQHDTDAAKLSAEVDKLIDAVTPSFWFWPGKDDWQRKFGWWMTHSAIAPAIWDAMFDELKTFVDGRR